MRLIARPMVSLVAIVVMTVLVACGGGKKMKLVVERETVVHNPVIRSVSIDGQKLLDTREQGHVVAVSILGDPGLTATFDVSGMFDGRAMSEGPAGTYRGSFAVPQGVQGKIEVTGHLLHPPSGAKAAATTTSPLDLWISPAPQPVGCTSTMMQDFDERLKGMTVQFGVDSDEIPEDAQARLRAAANLLNANELCRIMIYGHTDLTGEASYNKYLSIKRAIKVGLFLESLGVKNSRLEKHAKGDKYPIARGTTEEDHAMNRRAEIRALVLYE